MFKDNPDLVAKKLLAIWNTVRYLSSEDQMHPRFVGWVYLSVSKMLLPINENDVSSTNPDAHHRVRDDYSSIQRLQRAISKQSNMQYTHITFDVGAAKKAYYIILSSSHHHHLQAGLCCSGSIKGLISGKHYNRCLLHESFSEALERLFLQQYIPDVSAMIQEFAQEQPALSDVSPLLNDELVAEYEKLYNAQKRKCLDGDFGRTPRFWAMYMKLVERQKKLHYGTNVNDFDLRLLIWKQPLTNITLV